VQTPFGIQIRDIRADIDEPLLMQIADMTDGKYFRATDNEKFMQIYREIDELEKSKIDVTEFRRKYEEFLPLALLALLLLIGEFMLRTTLLRTTT
jgi:Ca-activated chloride channel family protein